LRIISALADEKELCPCQITELLQVTGPTVSRHLALLSQAALVTSRKQGRWIFFSIHWEAASLLFDWLTPNLKNSDQYHEDQARLREILTHDPEDICRKQRGETCCPVKEER